MSDGFAGVRPSSPGPAVPVAAAFQPPSAAVVLADSSGTGGPGATTERPATGGRRFRLGSRPPLTGIRALCLAFVLSYHSNFRSTPGAWAALGIFFVLSGFLITSMLAGEADRTGRISLAAFYSRRATRLLPPLLLTIALLAVYASFFHVADASQRVWGDSAAALFYYADYRQALGHAPFFGYLAQTWSLSVEEQFYIIWSVLMLAATALGRRSVAYGLCVVGFTVSVADRLWIVFSASHFDHRVFARVYYAFDTRADALFLGCLLGLIASGGHLNDWRRRSKQVLTVLAFASGAILVWIGFSVPLWTRNLTVWWLPVSEIASVIVITYFVVKPQGIGSRLVGLKVLVYIGDLSYTVYLVHFPVYLAVSTNSTHWPYWPTELVRLAIIFTIAILSWHVIEQPLTRWRRRTLAP